MKYLIADEVKKIEVIVTNKITVTGEKLIDDDGHSCYKYNQIHVDMKVIATRCTLGTDVHLFELSLTKTKLSI